MAGDLEDFLRRAAERRQQKAAQGGGPPPQQKRPAAPEYSDARTERKVRQHDAPVMAEIASDPEHDANAARKRKIALAKQMADRARMEAAQREKKVDDDRAADKANVASQLAAKRAKAAAAAAPVAIDSVHDLIKILKAPGGLRQAVLLREILDRPDQRW
ncbi:MAG: hypothetical protein HKN47_23120 [Pirellulaceae bacterium]|nr:hypothetical protein [Pirellulaceae bacterium]